MTKKELFTIAVMGVLGGILGCVITIGSYLQPASCCSCDPCTCVECKCEVSK